jgi:hypothetical protein
MARDADVAIHYRWQAVHEQGSPLETDYKIMREKYFLYNRADDEKKKALWEFLKNPPDDLCPACKGIKRRGREAYEDCQVCKGTGLVPCDYFIAIKKHRPVRSIKANKFYWAIINIYAIETGHTKKEIENMFKMDRHFKIIEYPNGRTEKVPADTHESETDEFAAVVNNLLDWGRDNFPRVVIPRKEDMHYKMLMEIDNKYNETFSGF